MKNNASLNTREIELDSALMPKNFNSYESSFLEGSEFTDIHTPMIQNLAAEIVRYIPADEGKIKAIFYWVRDNIKYSVGLNNNKASYTVLKGHGSCLNKSNLLVALLRANGIPAAFSVMRVKTREYFGPLGFKRYRPLVSEESNHTYTQALVSDRWIKLDCTDDIDLCESTHHLEMQGQPVDFDGYNHACLNLDLEHIVRDDERLQQNLDHIFRKKPKVPKSVINIFNICMRYVRHNGKFYDTVEEVEHSFFTYFETHHPREYRLFQVIESTKTSRPLKALHLLTYQLKRQG